MTFLLTLLRFIPGISSLISTITTKWMDTKAQMYAERMGVTKEIAAGVIRAQAQDNQTKVGWLNAVAGSRFLQVIVGGFAGPWIVYGWKVIVWDNIIHKFFWDTYGFTPPIGGLVGEWATIILSGIFVTSTSMVAAGAFVSKVSKDA